MTQDRPAALRTVEADLCRVEARYSDSYAITADDLDALATSIARLRDIVEEVCRERLAALKAETEAWMSASADARCTIGKLAAPSGVL